MKHWSLSISYEYCSVGNTSAPSLCGVARNCPRSNECVDFSDTFSPKASTLPELPDVFCEDEHNPKVFSGEHRKMPTSAEHHKGGDRLQANVLDGLCGNSSVRVEGVSPEGRTRRKILSAHWMLAGLRTCGLVFFRLKPRVVAFFPRFGAPELDFFLMKNRPKRFNTDRGNNLFLDEILQQFFQRPAFVRTAQKVRRTFGCFRDKSLVIFGKLRRPAGTRLWFQSPKATFIKFLDNCTNMMFRVMNQFCDCRGFIALFGS
jgi:hypothetical protein